MLKLIALCLLAFLVVGCAPAGEIEYTIPQEELEQVRIEHIKMAEDARRNGEYIFSPFEIKMWQK